MALVMADIVSYYEECCTRILPELKLIKHPGR